MAQTLPSVLTSLLLAASLAGCTAFATLDGEKVAYVYVVNETPQEVNVTVELDGAPTFVVDIPAADAAGHVKGGHAVPLKTAEILVKAKEARSGATAEERFTLTPENSIVVRVTSGGLVIEHHDEKVLFA